jgi:hypothetical protein
MNADESGNCANEPRRGAMVTVSMIGSGDNCLGFRVGGNDESEYVNSVDSKYRRLSAFIGGY